MSNIRINLSVTLFFLLFLIIVGCGDNRKIEKKASLYEKNSINFDLNSSLINWTVHRQNDKIQGTLKFSKGFLKLEKGMPVSGTCSIDMNSIHITNIGDTSETRRFEEYLKSEAYLNSSKYPEATFTMNSIIPLKAPSKPDVNTTIKGSINIKDSVLSAGITALTNYYPDSLTSKANFSLNGALWNIPLSKIRFGNDYKNNPFKEDFDIEVFVLAR